MTEKSLSQLRRAVLSRANAGKRVSPTDLKILLGAEWIEQQELQASLVNTVANLQAVEENKRREARKFTEDFVDLMNANRELEERVQHISSYLNAVEEDRARDQLRAYSRADAEAAESLEPWEDLSAVGEGPTLDYRDGISFAILLLGAFALLLYLI